MFNLFKKEKNKGIINEIHNNNITFQLANYGVSLLVKGKDFENTEGMKCILGYCVTGIDGQLESLFKIETDKIIAYYQAVRGSVTRLNIDENMFNAAIDIFFSNNKDLSKELVTIELK